jgi:hypothetical protein
MKTSRIQIGSEHTVGAAASGGAPLLTDAQTAAAARLVHSILEGRASDGAPSLAVLVGPAGVGKTLVLDRVAARLAAPPCIVTCRPGEDLALLPQGGPPAGAAAPVLVLDDAHRLTDAGLRALESLIGPKPGRGPSSAAGRPCAAVVCSGRGRLMTLLTRRVGLVSRVGLRATIGPMTAEETGRLVARLGGFPDDGLARRLHELTGGVPRAVLRLCGIADVVGGRGLSPDELDRLERRTSLPAA